jgi:hypothetical protein
MPVEEMNTDTFRVFELIRQPIMVAFVDLHSQDKKVREDSIRLVDDALPEVAPAFFYGLVIAYADNTLYNKHRKLLGVAHQRTPAISINDNEQKVVPYPINEPQTVEKIKTWLVKFTKGELQSKDSGFGTIVDHQI